MKNYIGLRHKSRPGEIPGSMPVPTGIGEECTVDIIEYGVDNFEQTEEASIADLDNTRDPNTVTWVNVNGLNDVDWLKAIGKKFMIHPLVLEDIQYIDQRPKFEDNGEYVYLTFKMLRFVRDRVVHEHVSLLLGDNWVVSFQEEKGDVFDNVRSRISQGKGRIRSKGADYLACVLLDLVVDYYFLVLEELGNDIEELEEMVFGEPRKEQLEMIHRVKKELLSVRKAIMPLREGIAQIDRSGTELIEEDVYRYYRDVYDHIVQLSEIVESYRDVSASLKDVYMSAVSFRMNKVMQVLTIIATIFIPLTFIVGVYGMNFDNMPELDWEYGYMATWIVMIIIAIAMLLYFRRKKWF